LNKPTETYLAHYLTRTANALSTKHWDTRVSLSFHQRLVTINGRTVKTVNHWLWLSTGKDGSMHTEVLQGL